MMQYFSNSGKIYLFPSNYNLYIIFNELQVVFLKVFRKNRKCSETILINRIKEV